MHETPDDFYTAVYSDFKEDAKNTLDALIEILETK